jgi:hypothetical protein
MKLSVNEFYHEVQKLAKEYLPAAKIETREINPFRLKMRLVLSPALFIDIFYGAGKRRIDFALIKERKRIFGIDNLAGWHKHPVGEPDRHESVKEMSLQEIFSQFAKIIEQQRPS